MSDTDDRSRSGKDATDDDPYSATFATEDESDGAEAASPTAMKTHDHTASTTSHQQLTKKSSTTTRATVEQRAHTDDEDAYFSDIAIDDGSQDESEEFALDPHDEKSSREPPEKVLRISHETNVEPPKSLKPGEAKTKTKTTDVVVTGARRPRKLPLDHIVATGSTARAPRKMDVFSSEQTFFSPEHRPMDETQATALDKVVQP